MSRAARAAATSPPKTKAAQAAEPAHRVRCHLDELLKQRGMTLTELASRAGVTVANLAVLKNGRARAVRFSTLTALCEVLECSPGDLLTIEP